MASVEAPHIGSEKAGCSVPYIKHAKGQQTAAVLAALEQTKDSRANGNSHSHWEHARLQVAGFVIGYMQLQDAPCALLHLCYGTDSVLLWSSL